MCFCFTDDQFANSIDHGISFWQVEKGLEGMYKRGLGYPLYICIQSRTVAVDNCHERLTRKSAIAASTFSASFLI
jgi:hypothetical protein